MTEQLTLNANLGLLLRGPIRDLERVLNRLAKEDGVRVIYRKLSANKLVVVEEALLAAREEVPT